MLIQNIDAQAACETIWAQERAIYRGRAGGSLSAYRAALAPGYLAWPPHQAAPIGSAGLADRAMESQEVLEMHLTDFTLHGATAIIYYQTHRTVRPDGTKADDRFDVIHVWVEEHGVWKIFGGMARPMTTR